MPRQVITTADAPSSPLCSQGVKAGPHLLVSGIVGIDPGTGSLAGDTIQHQARQALTNCEAAVAVGLCPGAGFHADDEAPGVGHRDFGAGRD
jgi:enamine deaminase RidA (YjgF/YER057c/UK114 family)